MVATFRMLSDEVRRNIPDILLATMNILFTKHKVKNGIPVWVSISDGHWKISIHFQKIREITSCTSEKKSDFHMGHVEIWFPHDPWRNHF